MFLRKVLLYMYQSNENKNTLLIMPPFSTTASAPDKTKSTFYNSKATAESNIIFTGIP